MTATRRVPTPPERDGAFRYGPATCVGGRSPTTGSVGCRPPTTIEDQPATFVAQMIPILKCPVWLTRLSNPNCQVRTVLAD